MLCIIASLCPKSFITPKSFSSFGTTSSAIPSFKNFSLVCFKPILVITTSLTFIIGPSKYSFASFISAISFMLFLLKILLNIKPTIKAKIAATAVQINIFSPNLFATKIYPIDEHNAANKLT